MNGFTITAESINSDAEEASFLVGVPSANIQKVIIPVEGYPYPMKDKEISFEVVTQYGDLTVTKRRDRGDQRVLAGATFQLYNASSQPVGSPVTTGADGIASWTGLEYGTYYLQETAAPAGYQLDSSMVTIGIDSPSVTYTANDPPIIGSVKVIKKENGKTLVDLRAANRRRLLQLGVPAAQIDCSQECTMCSHEKYWSHRYSKGRRGIQAACIVLE